VFSSLTNWWTCKYDLNDRACFNTLRNFYCSGESASVVVEYLNISFSQTPEPLASVSRVLVSLVGLWFIILLFNFAKLLELVVILDDKFDLSSTNYFWSIWTLASLFWFMLDLDLNELFCWFSDYFWTSTSMFNFGLDWYAHSWLVMPLSLDSFRSCFIRFFFKQQHPTTTTTGSEHVRRTIFMWRNG